MIDQLWQILMMGQVIWKPGINQGEHITYLSYVYLYLKYFRVCALASTLSFHLNG